MPFARIKPLNEGLGYKLRSYAAAGLGLRMQIGPNTENPLWFQITSEQAAHLHEQKVNPRDPSSPSKFDILPDQATADAFVKAESERKRQVTAGTSVADAIPMSPELIHAQAKRDSEVETLKAMVGRLQAELRAMKHQEAVSAVEPELAAPEAFEPPEASAEVQAALAEQGEPVARPTSITSAATAAVKRALPKRS